MHTCTHTHTHDDYKPQTTSAPVQMSFCMMASGALGVVSLLFFSFSSLFLLLFLSISSLFLLREDGTAQERPPWRGKLISAEERRVPCFAHLLTTRCTFRPALGRTDQSYKGKPLAAALLTAGEWGKRSVGSRSKARSARCTEEENKQLLLAMVEYD